MDELSELDNPCRERAVRALGGGRRLICAADVRRLGDAFHAAGRGGTGRRAERSDWGLTKGDFGVRVCEDGQARRWGVPLCTRWTAPAWLPDSSRSFEDARLPCTRGPLFVSSVPEVLSVTQRAASARDIGENSVSLRKRTRKSTCMGTKARTLASFCAPDVLYRDREGSRICRQRHEGNTFRSSDSSCLAQKSHVLPTPQSAIPPHASWSR